MSSAAVRLSSLPRHLGAGAASTSAGHGGLGFVASLRLDEGLARTLEHFRGGRVPRSASAARTDVGGRWVDSSVARRYSYRMRSSDEQTPSDAESDEREMWLLREIERSPQISQRKLSQRLSIALGVTNLLIRNLTRRGYVRVTRAGWRKWVYAITPAGFKLRAQLTVAYIQRVLYQYRGVRETIKAEIAPLGLHLESRLALYGTGEFAELVYLGLRDAGIDEVDVYAPGESTGARFLGMEVRPAATLLPEEYDRVIVASLNGGEAAVRELGRLGVGPDRLVTFFGSAEPAAQTTIANEAVAQEKRA